MDYSKLSDQDLVALKSGDYSQLSNEGLQHLHQQTAPPSQLESGVRGAIQGATLGYGDEIQGGLEAAYHKLVDSHKSMIDLYKEHRDEARAKNKAAEDANPKTYLGGNLAGGIGSAIATGGTSLPAMVGLGAASGLGASDADLTQGQVGKAAIDTGVGAAGGLVLGGVAKGLGALKSSGNQIAERLAIKSLNAAPEETGAMLKAVGQDNRDSVGRTLLKQKILGKYGLATDTGVAENLQRASDKLGTEQSAMINSLGNKSADLNQIKDSVLNKLDVPYSTEGAKANSYVQGQFDHLPQGEGQMGLKDLAAVKKQWQGLSEYPSAGSPTPQDVSNSSAMTKATAGIRQTMGDVAPELNPQLRSESNVFQARESMRTRPDLLSTHGSSMLATGIRASKSYGNQVGAVSTDAIHNILQRSPQVLGKYADVLSQAANRSPESLKATLHVLSMSDPEFRDLSQQLQDPSE